MAYYSMRDFLEKKDDATRDTDGTGATKSIQPSGGDDGAMRDGSNGGEGADEESGNTDGESDGHSDSEADAKPKSGAKSK
jgi:hypothetical protein